MHDGWRNVCTSETLIEGKALHFQIDAIDLLLVRVAGAIHAVNNLCTHAHACLHEGRLRGSRIICPLHGASFDVRTGAVLGKPATVPLERYDVREANGEVRVLLPPTAA